MSKSKSTRMRPGQAGSGHPGSVRIIAGRWRARRLPVPDLPELRPTGDRIRETLFNWLAPVIVGARCLDLFAGSGVLGFESGSRGAAEVVLVDRSPVVTAVLERESRRLNAESMTIVCADAMQWLLQSRERGFDVVFLDPPFNYEGFSEICARLEATGTVLVGGHIYIEHNLDRSPPILPGNWAISHEKKAGRVRYYLARPE